MIALALATQAAERARSRSGDRPRAFDVVRDFAPSRRDRASDAELALCVPLVGARLVA